jgi:hypothetical protein
MRRLTVLGPPLQLVFPDISIGKIIGVYSVDMQYILFLTLAVVIWKNRKIIIVIEITRSLKLTCKSTHKCINYSWELHIEIVVNSRRRKYK